MATPNTLRLPKFQLLMERYGRGAVPVPCPGLMECVESLDWESARKYLIDALAPYHPGEIDSVVLGCTHYVFLRPLLAELLPENVHILDGNEGTARQLYRVLEAANLLADRETGHA